MSSPSASPTAQTSLDDALRNELATLRARHLERTLRPLAHRRGAMVDVAGRDSSRAVLDFSSNDYLGLAGDARLIEAAERAARAHGTGAAASRLISGDNPEHHALEDDLARLLGVESALLFASGYAANVGAIPALAGRGDVIFADALNHASLIDGCRLSRATIHVYPHTDAGALRSLVATHRSSHRRALIVTDGVFSMDGDRAPLVEIADIARAFDAWTYVDDAHAVGVVGPDGRGTAASLGVDGAIDVTVGTLGKAFGSAGAFVSGSRTLHDYLLNKARSFVFSTGSPPGQAAAAREAVRIAAAEPWRRAAIAGRAAELRDGLSARGLGRDTVLGERGAAIVPIVVSGAERVVAVGRTLAADGFLVGAVRPPTVAAGTERLRATVTAAHTSEQVGALADAIARALSANR